MKTRLTERDLNRIVKRVINEQSPDKNLNTCTRTEARNFMKELTNNNNEHVATITNAPAMNGEYLKLEGFGMKCVCKKIDFLGAGI